MYYLSYIAFPQLAGLDTIIFFSTVLFHHQLEAKITYCLQNFSLNNKQENAELIITIKLIYLIGK